MTSLCCKQRVQIRADAVELQTALASAASTAAKWTSAADSIPYKQAKVLYYLLDFVVGWVVRHFELCGAEQLRRCAGSSQVNAVRGTRLNKACSQQPEHK
jgi:hypothetical protein